jgi:prephenate dehydrogenase/3-phosphoshikimate 1-carboxyvinyltransferase
MVGPGVRQVTVIGCGLIGGSLLKALRAKGETARLSAVDRPDVLAAAGELLDDAAEAGSTKASSLVHASDLVVLAMPIGGIIRSLDWVLAAISDEAVVTDTGSVKRPIVAAARSSSRVSRFVAGHPMAGREIGGFEASSADLFEKARWFIMKEAGEGSAAAPDRAAIDRVAALARAVGAEPVQIEPDAHDRAMAYVSHAPQLISSAVYATAARAGVLGEAGPGFRDVTRISGAPATMWRDIFETNRDELAAALGDILEPLVELSRMLRSGDAKAIDSAVHLLQEAHAEKARRNASLRPKGEPLP